MSTIMAYEWLMTICRSPHEYPLEQCGLCMFLLWITSLLCACPRTKALYSATLGRSGDTDASRVVS